MSLDKVISQKTFSLNNPIASVVTFNKDYTEGLTHVTFANHKLNIDDTSGKFTSIEVPDELYDNSMYTYIDNDTLIMSSGKENSGVWKIQPNIEITDEYIIDIDASIYEDEYILCNDNKTLLYSDGVEIYTVVKRKFPITYCRTSTGCLISADELVLGIYRWNAQYKTLAQKFTNGNAWNVFQPVEDGVLIGSTDVGNYTGLLAYRESTDTVTRIISSGSRYQYFQPVEAGCLIASSYTNNSGVYLFNASTWVATKVYASSYQWNNFCPLENGGVLIGGMSGFTGAVGVLYYNPNTLTVTRIHATNHSWSNLHRIDGGALVSNSYTDKTGILYFNNDNLSITSIYPNNYNWSSILELNDCVLIGGKNNRCLLIDKTTLEVSSLIEVDLSYTVFTKIDNVVLISSSDVTKKGLYAFDTISREISKIYNDGYMYDKIYTRSAQYILVGSSLENNNLVLFNTLTLSCSEVLNGNEVRVLFEIESGVKLLNSQFSSNGFHTMYRDEILTEYPIGTNAVVEKTSDHGVFLNYQEEFNKLFFFIEDFHTAYMCTKVCGTDISLYTSTFHRKLIIYDHNNDSAIIIPDILMQGSIATAEISTGYLICGTGINGIYHFNTTTKEISSISTGYYSTIQPVLNGFLISSSSASTMGIQFFDNRNNSLISIYPSGRYLNYLPINGGCLIYSSFLLYYNEDNDSVTQLISDYVYNLHPNNNGCLINSKEGLFFFKASTKKLIHEFDGNIRHVSSSIDDIHLVFCEDASDGELTMFLYNSDNQALQYIDISYFISPYSWNYTHSIPVNSGWLLYNDYNATTPLYYIDMYEHNITPLVSFNHTTMIFHKMNNGVIICSNMDIYFYNDLNKTCRFIFYSGEVYQHISGTQDIAFLSTSSSTLVFDINTLFLNAADHELYSKAKYYHDLGEFILITGDSDFKGVSIYDKNTRTLETLYSRGYNWSKFINVDGDVIITHDKPTVFISYKDQEAGLLIYNNTTQTIRRGYTFGYGWDVKSVDTQGTTLTTGITDIYYQNKTKRIAFNKDTSIYNDTYYIDTRNNGIYISYMYKAPFTEDILYQVTDIDQNWKYFCRDRDGGYYVAGSEAGYIFHFDKNDIVTIIETNPDFANITMWQSLNYGSIFLANDNIYYLNPLSNNIKLIQSDASSLYNSYSYNDNGLFRIYNNEDMSTGILIDENTGIAFVGNCNNTAASRVKNEDTYVSSNANGTFYFHNDEYVYIDHTKQMLYIKSTSHGCLMSCDSVGDIYYFSSLRKDIKSLYNIGSKWTCMHNTPDGMLISSTVNTSTGILYFDEPTETITKTAITTGYMYEICYNVNSGCLLNSTLSTSVGVMYFDYETKTCESKLAAGYNLDKYINVRNYHIFYSTTAFNSILTYDELTKTIVSFVCPNDVEFERLCGSFIVFRIRSSMKMHIYDFVINRGFAGIYSFGTYTIVGATAVGGSIWLYDDSIGEMWQLYTTGYSWSLSQPVAGGCLLTGGSIYCMGVLFFDAETLKITQIHTTATHWISFQPVDGGFLLGSNSVSYESGILYYDENTRTCTQIWNVGQQWRYHEFGDGLLCYSSSSENSGLLYYDPINRELTQLTSSGYYYDVLATINNETYLFSSKISTHILWYNSQLGKFEIVYDGLYCSGNSIAPFIYTEHGCIFRSMSATVASLSIVYLDFNTHTAEQIYTDSFYWNSWHSVNNNGTMEYYLYSGSATSTNNAYGILKYIEGDATATKIYPTGYAYTGYSQCEHGIFFFGTNNNADGIIFYDGVTAECIYTNRASWYSAQPVEGGYLIYSNASTASGIVYYDIASKNATLIYSASYGTREFYAIENGWIISGVGTSPVFKDLLYYDNTAKSCIKIGNFFNMLPIASFGNDVFLTCTTSIYPGIWYYNKSKNQISQINTAVNNWKVVKKISDTIYFITRYDEEFTSISQILYSFNTETDIELQTLIDGYFKWTNIYHSDNYCLTWSNNYNGLWCVNKLDNTITNICEIGYGWTCTPVYDGILMHSLSIICYFKTSTGELIFIPESGLFTDNLYIIETPTVILAYSTNSSNYGIYKFDKSTASVSILYDDIGAWTGHDLGDYVIFAAATNNGIYRYDKLTDVIEKISDTGYGNSVIPTNDGCLLYNTSNTVSHGGLVHYNENERCATKLLDRYYTSNIIPILNGYVISSPAYDGIYYFDLITHELTVIYDVINDRFDNMCAVSGGYLCTYTGNPQVFSGTGVLFIDEYTLECRKIYEDGLNWRSFTDSGDGVFITPYSTSHSNGILYYNNNDKSIRNLINYGYWNTFKEFTTYWLISVSNSQQINGLLYFDKSTKELTYVGDNVYGSLSSTLSITEGEFIYMGSSGCGVIFFDPYNKRAIPIGNTFHTLSSVVEFEHGVFVISNSSSYSLVYFDRKTRLSYDADILSSSINASMIVEVDDGYFISRGSSETPGLLFFSKYSKHSTLLLDTGYGAINIEKFTGGYLIFGNTANFTGIVYYNTKANLAHKIYEHGYGYNTNIYNKTKDGFFIYSNSESGLLYIHDIENPFVSEIYPTGTNWNKMYYFNTGGFVMNASLTNVNYKLAIFYDNSDENVDIYNKGYHWFDARIKDQPILYSSDTISADDFVLLQLRITESFK